MGGRSVTTDSSSQPDPQDLLDTYVDGQAPATMAGMHRDLALRIKAKGMRQGGAEASCS